MNYLLDKEYFEGGDGDNDQQNKNGIESDLLLFEKEIDNMDKQQFKEKFDAKPLSICEEEEEDEDDWFPYLNKNSTSDELYQKTSNDKMYSSF